MPILWRYLLGQYLRVLLLCTVSFIAILLVMRLDEIAHFATLGPSGWHIFLFILHQIPYILPIVIPISSLIASTLLMQQLSQTHELTAMRASGMSLKKVFSPILLFGANLAILNFILVSEMSTQSHLTTGLLKTELRAINPLLLMHNKHLMRLKGFYYDALGPSQMGESASDVILAVPNKSNKRLNLVIAKKLQANTSLFSGDNVTIISGLGTKEESQFDQLMLENIAYVSSSVDSFAQMMQKKVWSVNNDHLKMPLLLARLNEEKSILKASGSQKPISPELKQTKRAIHKCYSEIVRRSSIAFAAFSFTLMGAAFGITIGRRHSRRGLYLVIALAALYLISYFTATGNDHLIFATSLLYLGPHLLIIALSLWSLNRVTRGLV